MDEKEFCKSFHEFDYWTTNQEWRLRDLESLLAYRAANDEPIEDVVQAIQILQATRRGFIAQLLLRIFKRETSQVVMTVKGASFLNKSLSFMLIILLIFFSMGALTFASLVTGFELGRHPNLFPGVSRTLGERSENP